MVQLQPLPLPSALYQAVRVLLAALKLMRRLAFCAVVRASRPGIDFGPIGSQINLEAPLRLPTWVAIQVECDGEMVSGPAVLDDRVVVIGHCKKHLHMGSHSG